MASEFKTYKTLDLPKIGSQQLDFWKTHKVFDKSVSNREGATPFIFFEGPPSANGLPGIHHVLARTIKDVFCRYKTQKGFQVHRKAGWDTHGLPIELGVEKELGITKEDIGVKISVEAYNEACKKAVMRYTDVWNKLTESFGYWVDMDNPYVTYTSKYMESVWWVLSQLFEKDLLYKGYSIQPYSPKAGTGLSSHELNQPGTYKNVSDTTVVAQFKAIGNTLPPELTHYKNLHFLAWTTTPWTLPSNTALTVGPKIEYTVVSTYNQYTHQPIQVILATALINTQFSGKYKAVNTDDELNTYTAGDKTIPYKIQTTLLGSSLEGIRYEPLFNYTTPFENPENAFRVILGQFVTTEDGTGIVHTAPTFGADDAKVAQEATPPVPPMLVKDEAGNLVPLVDLQGKFRPEVGPFAGKYVKNEYYTKGEAPEKSVDVEIAIQLKTENKAFRVEKYAHTYPHCWRTDKPILYYPLDSWFIKVTAKKDRLVALNNTIQWKPSSTGEGRFGNWLANANDWNLSRSRFWGIPLPIWRTKDKKEVRCISDIASLKQAMAEAHEAGVLKEPLYADFVEGDFSEDNYQRVDLHKNVVDKIVLVSPSGKPMYREPDLIDVWFDSGSMPYAQWHYPFENKDKVDKVWRKADFIAEGVDQTRGWFYTLHVIATLLFDDVAYKNVISNGLVLDKNGQKMSKRLNNAVDPFEILSKYGPDATRWYMLSNANPWDNLKFDADGIAEVRNKFFGTLYNTYSFFSLYANLDQFTNKEPQVPHHKRSELDRWILSELHTLIKEVDKAYNDYDATKASRAISYFVQENLSNWYVRLSRRRFWKAKYETDKISAYQTLYQCLEVVACLAAPIAPFYMDRLYQDLTSVTQGVNKSVHLTDFPKASDAFIDNALEKKMQRAQRITSLVLSLRQREKIKVRQPLAKIMIPVMDAEAQQQIEALSTLIKSEVNVKEIELIEPTNAILVKQIKPNFKKLGPRFGKQMKAVANSINTLSQEAIATFEHTGTFTIDVEDQKVTLTLEDVQIQSQDIEGWLVASQDGDTVALDCTITESLAAEGIARELVNRIQNQRKDSGFEVTDRILITLQKDTALENAVSAHQDYIKEETLTDALHFVTEVKDGIDVKFDAISTKMQLKKSK